MSAPFDNNVYRATVLRHVDADTTYCRVNLGADVSINMTVRWASIDAPERNTVEGKAATAVVNEWLPVGSRCNLQTTEDKREKFGRYLGTFTVDGVNLNQRLIDEGYAVAYDGGKR